MGRKLLMMFAVAVILIFSTQVMAQEEDMDIEYSFGIFVKSDEGSLTLEEYDFSSGEDTAVVYMVDEDTVLENISDLKALVEGDEISVEYKIQGDEKLAVNVYKDEVADDEPNEGIEEDSDEDMNLQANMDYQEEQPKDENVPEDEM